MATRVRHGHHSRIPADLIRIGGAILAPADWCVSGWVATMEV